MALAALSAGLILSGCSPDSERVTFDGNYFPTKVKGERGDRRSFTATARRAGRGVEGAQKAARHAATKYCIERFGASDIAWAPGKDGQDGPVFVRSGSRIAVKGRCEIWK